MTIPLPDDVQDAIMVLATKVCEAGLVLASLEIKRVVRKPHVQAYLLATPGGVVTIKQEM